MAKNNGSRASSGSSSTGSNPGQRKRSSTHRNDGGSASSSTSRRVSGSRSGSSSSRSKSNPDVMSPISRGYQSGRRRGQTAVESIKSAGSRAVETVGEHPIPLVLIGAGLTWLLLESRGVRPTNARMIERSRDAIGGLGSTIADTAGTAGHAIADAFSGAAETVSEGASAVGEYVSNAASAVGETTSTGYEYARETLGNLWERHPIAMSAAILSAGVAAGMLLPATTRESNLLGGAATNVVKNARRKGTQLLEQGRRLAAGGVKVARRETERQGLTADEIVHKVKRVARAVASKPSII